ncbi:MAG: hypothetical protein KKB02_09290 [Alphaproteobacteria bacterium]|nr:hypothetical protein [Alphaproteobacteria bacterium]
MMFAIRRLFLGEEGAVTVDWVVLTAAVVGMGLMVALGLTTALTNGTDNIAAAMVE